MVYGLLVRITRKLVSGKIDLNNDEDNLSVQPYRSAKCKPECKFIENFNQK